MKKQRSPEAADMSVILSTHASQLSIRHFFSHPIEIPPFIFTRVVCFGTPTKFLQDRVQSLLTPWSPPRSSELN